MLSKSKKFNENYAAQIIKVKNLRQHPNADRLLIFTYQGASIITGNQTKEDDYVIYFPVECKINKDFLSQNNLFRKKELNVDPEQAGFFEPTGRVRALKLRGVNSEGFIMPLRALSGLEGVNQNWSTFAAQEGELFDTIGNTLLLEKYRVVKTNSAGGNKASKIKGAKLFSKLVDEQFKFHHDTPKLAANLEFLDLNDIISITYKLHGTSFVSSNILCKRKLNWFERLLKSIGVKIQDTEYDNIYSSRKVVKNEYLQPKNAKSFYKTDIWGDANDLLKDNLLKGESVYGEIVGYTKDGSQIQNGYDYGCDYGTFQVYIYRITHTNVDGKIVELNYKQITERAEELGVKAAPLLYYGSIHDWYLTNLSLSYDEYKDGDYDDSGDKWREYFFEFLRRVYVKDQDCHMCKNKVPAEGIALRVESTLRPRAYKFKSSRFLQHETKMLDQEVVDIEENN